VSMLGWEIHIVNSANGYEYGSWLGGINTTKWLERLVKDEKAEKTYQVASSYYLIKAKDLIPEITNFEIANKNGVAIEGWISDYVMDINKLKQCKLDEVIRVQTYDAS
jgi:hypothetical protein